MLPPDIPFLVMPLPCWRRPSVRSRRTILFPTSVGNGGLCVMPGTRRYPRAHAARHLKFKFELNLPFVHSLLMLHVPPDDSLIQPHGRREKSRRPQHCPPVRPLQFGIPPSQLLTQIGFHLPHNTRYGIFRRYHQHHVNMVNLDTPLLNLYIGMKLLNLRYLLLDKDVECPRKMRPRYLGNHTT